MTGTGLGAILFGPSAVSILGIIVLVFQAVLLAHGGLTTLGANTFSMAIAGPLVSFGIYKLCTHTKMNRRAGSSWRLLPGPLYILCDQHPAGAGLSVGGRRRGGVCGEIPGRLCTDPAAACGDRGILTVVIVIGLETYAKPELRAIGFFGNRKEA